jgi:hypothetical protein
MEHIAAQLLSLSLSPSSHDQQILSGPSDPSTSFVNTGMEPRQDYSARQRLEYIRFSSLPVVWFVWSEALSKQV